MYGVDSNILHTSPNVKSIPTSLAIAGKCSPALVEPPEADTTIAELINACFVTISLGFKFLLIKSITVLPLSYAYWSLLVYGAGVIAEPGRDSPIVSDTQAIVFAVNWPPQAPAEGHATHSMSWRSLSDILPVECFPTASNTSTIVTSLPLYEPGRMEPPYIKTEGIFNLSIAIIKPGRDLSQLAKPISPS